MVFLSASLTAVTRLCRSIGQKHISAVSLTGMLSIITAFSRTQLLAKEIEIETLFTWSGGPQSSGVGFFCFVSFRE